MGKSPHIIKRDLTLCGSTVVPYKFETVDWNGKFLIHSRITDCYRLHRVFREGRPHNQCKALKLASCCVQVIYLFLYLVNTLNKPELTYFWQNCVTGVRQNREHSGVTVMPFCYVQTVTVSPCVVFGRYSINGAAVMGGAGCFATFAIGW